jgi:hypothetical protein
VNRKRRSAGISLLAKPIAKKALTTTITTVIERPQIDNRISVIKYAPKNPIEVIEISDDDESQPSTSSGSNSKEVKRFANWILIEENGPTEIEKFKRVEKRASFEVNHNIDKSIDLMEYQQQIDDSYEAAIKHFISEYPEDYLYSAKLEHENLKKSIYLHPERIGSFDKTRFLNKVFMVSQSNEEFLINGKLNVEVVIYKRVVGSGKRTTRAPQTYDEEKHKKTSIVVVKNNG